MSARRGWAHLLPPPRWPRPGAAAAARARRWGGRRAARRRAATWAGWPRCTAPRQLPPQLPRQLRPAGSRAGVRPRQLRRAGGRVSSGGPTWRLAPPPPRPAACRSSLQTRGSVWCRDICICTEQSGAENNTMNKSSDSRQPSDGSWGGDRRSYPPRAAEAASWCWSAACSCAPWPSCGCCCPAAPTAATAGWPAAATAADCAPPWPRASCGSRPRLLRMTLLPSSAAVLAACTTSLGWAFLHSTCSSSSLVSSSSRHASWGCHLLVLDGVEVDLAHSVHRLLVLEGDEAEAAVPLGLLVH